MRIDIKYVISAREGLHNMSCSAKIKTGNRRAEQYRPCGPGAIRIGVAILLNQNYTKKVYFAFRYERKAAW